MSLLAMSFLGDYQFLLDMSSTRLFDMMEVQLLRFLLVEKYQREKHSRTIRRLKSKVNHVIKSVREGRKEVRLLRENSNIVKELTRELDT